MVNSLQQTTSADVDAVPETVVAESQAPTGTANSALPMVGTNKVSQWATWDPNLWWTDWSLPPDPRPSWEQWFDWVNQLKALVPALGDAGRDWQTMIGQFDDSLQTVRGMRADLATWTGPSATTMSASLDGLENSITTRAAAIRDNPGKLQQLAQTINDAVAPMSALDAEYQQVLNDLVACRQVAERGKPIMLNLATTLLRTGTDLENSVQTENLAPQPVAPQQLALTDGPQGPTQQLTQVAGSANLADPGNVGTAAPVAVAAQPGPAGSGNLTDPGLVQSAPPAAASHVPGVAVSPTDPAAANLAMPAQSSAAVAATPTLAGASAGAAAPVVPTGSAAPVAAMPTATPSPVMPMAPVVATSAVPAATPVAPMAAPVGATAAVTPSVAPAKERSDVVAIVGVPAVAGPTTSASGSVAVPTGLRGRNAGLEHAITAITGVAGRGNAKPKTLRTPDDAEPLDAEVFEADDAGTGMLTARSRQ